MIVSDAESHKRVIYVIQHRTRSFTKITNSGSKLYAWCKKPAAEGYKVETSHGSRIWFVVMTGRYDLIAFGRAMMYLEAFFFEAILAIFRRNTMRCFGNRRRFRLMIRSVATICVSCNFFSSSSFLGCHSWFHETDLHHRREEMNGRLNVGTFSSYAAVFFTNGERYQQRLSSTVR